MTYQSREERSHACTLTEAHHSLVEISHSSDPHRSPTSNGPFFTKKSRRYSTVSSKSVNESSFSWVAT